MPCPKKRTNERTNKTQTRLCTIASSPSHFFIAFSVLIMYSFLKFNHRFFVCIFAFFKYLSAEIFGLAGKKSSPKIEKATIDIFVKGQKMDS